MQKSIDIHKRIICIVLALFLAVGQFMTVELKAEAAAAEIIAGSTAISVGKAFAGFLATLGVAATGAYVGAHQDAIETWGSDKIAGFKQWVQDAGKTTADGIDSAVDAVDVFIDGLVNGIADTSSQAYQWAKEYVFYLYNNLKSATVENEYKFTAGTTLYMQIDGVGKNYWVLTYDCYVAIVALLNNGSLRGYQTIMIPCDFSVNSVLTGAGQLYSKGTSRYDIPLTPTGAYNTLCQNCGFNRYALLSGYMSVSQSKLSVTTTNFPVLRLETGGLTLSSYLDTYYHAHVSPNIFDIFGGAGSGVVDADYTVTQGVGSIGERDDSLDNLEQSGISAGAGTAAGSADLPMDWTGAAERLGESAFEKVLEKVASGELSWSDYMDAVGVIDCDIATDVPYVIADDRVTDTPKDEYQPNPDVYVPPEKPDYNDTDFTVTGLQHVFPFCIPFDLADFVGILSAEPQAPHFTIKCSFLGERFKDKTIDIDLAAWDKAAEIVRDMELLLFIVGLILLTRNIIRG